MGLAENDGESYEGKRHVRILVQTIWKERQELQEFGGWRKGSWFERFRSRCNEYDFKYWSKKRTIKCSTFTLNLGGHDSLGIYRN